MDRAHQSLDVERYLFRIGMIVMSPECETSTSPYLFEAVEGLRIRAGFEFSALSGMDVLKTCDLQLDRRGQCSLSFG